MTAYPLSFACSGYLWMGWDVLVPSKGQPLYLRARSYPLAYLGEFKNLVKASTALSAGAGYDASQSS